MKGTNYPIYMIVTRGEEREVEQAPQERNNGAPT